MARRRTGTSKGVFRWSIGIPPLLRQMPKILGDMGQDFVDFSEAFEQVPRILASEIGGNIRSRKTPEGTIWRQFTNPFTKRYQKRKDREGFGRAELVYNGDLLGQVSSAVGGRLTIKPLSLIWGTSDIEHAATVNFGAPDKGIHPRRFFGVTDGIREGVGRVIDSAAAKKLERARAMIARVK